MIAYTVLHFDGEFPRLAEGNKIEFIEALWTEFFLGREFGSLKGRIGVLQTRYSDGSIWSRDSAVYPPE